MANYKLRVKIGVHEFEAEGPAEDVKSQFEEWKQLIASTPGPSTAVDKNFLHQVTEIKTAQGYSTPYDIYRVDDKRKLLTLVVHPTGESREADAAILILYGYKEVNSRDEVPVTKLKESLEVSGLLPDRIDRILSGPIRDGLVMKAGRAKGGKYRLTNTGFKRAAEMARELFAQMAH